MMELQSYLESCLRFDKFNGIGSFAMTNGSVWPLTSLPLSRPHEPSQKSVNVAADTSILNSSSSLGLLFWHSLIEAEVTSPNSSHFLTGACRSRPAGIMGNARWARPTWWPMFLRPIWIWIIENWQKPGKKLGKTHENLWKTWVKPNTTITKTLQVKRYGYRAANGTKSCKLPHTFKVISIDLAPHWSA